MNKTITVFVDEAQNYAKPVWHVLGLIGLNKKVFYLYVLDCKLDGFMTKFAQRIQIELISKNILRKLFRAKENDQNFN